MPYVLKDGDILGYRINSEHTPEELSTDDFTTAEDIICQEKIKALKLVTENKKGKDEKELVINVGF